MHPELHLDEIVATLKRSSLPTVIIEGSDDLVVYRRLEEDMAEHHVSLMPVGGRTMVLELFRRRNEFSADAKIAFIADQDTWIETTIPAEFQDPALIFTTGYSIENDIFVDAALFALLKPAERAQFRANLELFVKWYALALSRHLADGNTSIAVHVNHVLDPIAGPPLFELAPNEQYPDALRAGILDEYERRVRGKSLLDLLLKTMDYKGRKPRHNKLALMEMAAVRPGALLSRIRSELVRALAA